LVGIGLFFATGIWAAARISLAPDHLFFLALYLLLLSFAFIRHPVSTPLIFLTVTLVAACTMKVSGMRDDAMLRREQGLPELGVELTGSIAGEPVYHPSAAGGRGTWTFPLRCEEVRESNVWKKQRGGIDVQLVRFGPSPVFGSGQRVRLMGQLYRQEFRGKNAVALRVVDEGDCEVLSEGPRISLAAWCRVWREKAAKRLEAGLDNRPVQMAILKALVLGYRKEIPKDTMDVFRRTGSVHIFAISGLHVGMVGLLLVIVLKSFGIPRDWFGVCLLPLLFMYVSATGMKASALRAMVMAGVFLLAPLFRRKPDIPNSVAFAALLLLLLNPAELQSAGFVFSFGVVIFIVMVFSAVPSHWLQGRWIKNYGLSLVITSVAASLASLPMTAFYFGRFSPIALLGNLAVVPLTFFIVLSGWLSVLIPAASSIFNHAALVFIDLMLHSVQWLDRLPGSSFAVERPPFPAVALWYGSMIYLFVQASGRRQRGFAVAGAGASVLWAVLA
jgi:ComEC/Rec2-related protein